MTQENKISDLNLSVRAINVLEKYVGLGSQLSHLLEVRPITIERVWRNCGKSTLVEIANELHRNGLTLMEEDLAPAWFKKRVTPVKYPENVLEVDCG